MGRRSGKSQIFSGIGFSIFFGFLTIWLHNPFIAIPLFFTGILPIMKGIDRQIDNKPQSRIENRQKPKNLSPDEQERMVLKCAREKRGIITPAIVAVETEIPITAAEKILEAMVHRGYATLEVRSTGGLEYRFEDFIGG